MAEDNKKRIQRKIDKVFKRLKDIAKRASEKDGIPRQVKLSALIKIDRAREKLTNAKYGSGGGLADDAEKTVESAEDDINDVEQMEGMEPEEEDEDKSDELERADDTRRQIKKQRTRQPKSKLKRPKKLPIKGGLKAGGAKAAAGGMKAGGLRAAAGLALKNPYVLAALLIILLVIVIIVSLIACSANKSYSEDGGSAFMAMDPQNPEHQGIALQARTAVNEGRLILAPDIQNDILGDNIYKLDYRVVQTLAYLSDKYKIGVNILYSNAPDYTHRENVSKEALELDNDEKSLEAFSAYKLGQAVGINSIGTVSPKLAKACDISGPVYVKWQEIADEGKIRPIYEQLQVDTSNLYFQVEGIADMAASDEDIATQIEQANTLLGQIQGNLNQLSTLESGFSGIQGYVADSLKYLSDVSKVLNQGSWDNVDSDLAEPMSVMVQRVFRIMQVANMEQWYGNKENNCRLWKAFEARVNIRKLVGDIMRMPVELAGPEDEGFNNEFVVKQLIVYSPEDDLDNGPMDWDVFPPGIISVGNGGIAIGSSENGDGIVDFRDNHFMSLPIDNGVFSKACAEFVYNVDDTNSMMAQATLSALVPEGLRTEMCRLLYGNKKVPAEGQMSGLVSYKKFIHIGF